MEVADQVVDPGDGESLTQDASGSIDIDPSTEKMIIISGSGGLRFGSPSENKASGIKEAGPAAIRRQQQLEEKTSLYMANSQVAALIFEPNMENHLVDATFTAFRQFILKNDWHIKRIPATDEEKRIYRTSGKPPKFWTYIGRTAKTLKDRLKKGHEVATTPIEDTYSASFTSGSFSSVPYKSSSQRTRKIVDPSKPKPKPSPYNNFRQSRKEEIKRAHPDASFKDLGRIYGSEWQKLSEAEKQLFVSRTSPTTMEQNQPTDPDDDDDDSSRE